MRKRSEERILRLRQSEQECYSVCYYLLGDERLAVQAAQQALCELFRSEDAAYGPERVRAAAMRQAVKLAARRSPVLL
ncbi:hypothetical protein ACTHPH_02245 [Paenibacillus pasadenensis]|uniref:Uncharacterized protein n=1 Tax=Paenibacillus pasadenensis TaxID=217090 RepID=A0A2N5N6P9_9BACL|nr:MULTISPECIES: hypothetical protein [Paenibacillus]PLT45983.1 hypothetical protein B8V81_4414 [Paenibacillus pasadenensis]QGG56478.1 hypothetical protein GE073_13390 [Paenibacillus sp. B01]